MSVAAPAAYAASGGAAVNAQPAKGATPANKPVPAARDRVETKAVAGAAVTLMKDGAHLLTTRSDAKGNFRVIVRGPGKYTLSISAPGYASGLMGATFEEPEKVMGKPVRSGDGVYTFIAMGKLTLIGTAIAHLKLEHEGWQRD